MEVGTGVGVASDLPPPVAASTGDGVPVPGPVVLLSRSGRSSLAM